MKSTGLKSLIERDMFPSPSELNQRFKSLRGSRLMPVDRGQAARDLTRQEIVNGILSVMDSRPGFASLIAICAKSLLPVGGEKRSYREAQNFGEALAMLLDHPDDLIELRVKGLEFDNRGIPPYAHGGRAQIYYEMDGIKQTAYFVPKNSVSLTSETSVDAIDYDPRKFMASFEREYVLGNAIFKAVNYTLEQEAAYKKATEAILMA